MDFAIVNTPIGALRIVEEDGYITDIDTMKLATLCNNLGAGRKVKGEPVNYKVGIWLNKNISDFIGKDELLMKVYTESDIDQNEYLNTIKISKENIEEPKIIFEVIK